VLGGEQKLKLVLGDFANFLKEAAIKSTNVFEAPDPNHRLRELTLKVEEVVARVYSHINS
jgi:hypothetical protein